MHSAEKVRNTTLDGEKYTSQRNTVLITLNQWVPRTDKQTVRTHIHRTAVLASTVSCLYIIYACGMEN